MSEYAELVERLRRTGLKSAAEAADAIEALIRERDEAILRASEADRRCGLAEGRLAMSEAAGVVEGWRERAEKAERERDEARALLRENAEVFRHYAALHRQKGSEDGGRKAMANDAHADRIDAHLSGKTEVCGTCGDYEVVPDGDFVDDAGAVYTQMKDCPDCSGGDR